MPNLPAGPRAHKPAPAPRNVSRVYAIKVARVVDAAELLDRPLKAVLGRFRGPGCVPAGAAGFARYDRVRDRVAVCLDDGRAFEAEGSAAAGYVRCLYDADGRRLGDPGGRGAAAFAALDAALDCPDEPRPEGAVGRPREWALGVLRSPGRPREWVDFARLILADRTGYYDRPGAWVVPPAVPGRGPRPPYEPDDGREARGAWGGHAA